MKFNPVSSLTNQANENSLAVFPFPRTLNPQDPLFSVLPNTGSTTMTQANREFHHLTFIMIIRIAKHQDLERLVKIYNQSIAAGQQTADTTPVTMEGRKKWFESHTPDKYPILVAEKNGSTVGYLTISAYRPGRNALRHTAEVSFYIDFDYHLQGIATLLLQYAIDICPSLQIKTLFAILIATNKGSVRFLEGFGFEKWGQLPRVAEFDGIEFDHLYYGLRIDKGRT